MEELLTTSSIKCDLGTYRHIHEGGRSSLVKTPGRLPRCLNNSSVIAEHIGVEVLGIPPSPTAIL